LQGLIGREQTARKGENPTPTGVCRGDCLKGGDHGHDSNPIEPATQTRGLPPKNQPNAHPHAPGATTSEHNVEGRLQLCCKTHPQDRCPACRSGTLCIPGCPKSAHPSGCIAQHLATLPPTTRPKATTRPLPVSCCLCCCTPALANTANCC
jgi:hypothetical protein